MKTNPHLARLSFTLLLPLLVASLRASPGCCGGTGTFGVDGRWAPLNLSSVPAKERVVSIHNASFGTTRGLFAEINALFGQAWVKKTSYSLTVNGSHGSTFAQTRAILAGASEPDFVTLDHPAAIDELATRGRFLPADWRSRLPNDSVPFTTAVSFLVRKGNPKAIRDWSDLAKPGVELVTPDPRLNSTGQWIYLAAWASALDRAGGDGEKARAGVIDLYRHVIHLNSGSDGAAAAFTERGVGDVLLLLENDALARAARDPAVEIVTPPVTLRVDLPVAWIDRNVDRHGTTRVTASYLIYLYTPEAQEIAARHHYRPVDETVAQKYAASFPSTRLLTLEKSFGGWPRTHKRFFAPDAILERDYTAMTTREIVAATATP